MRERWSRVVILYRARDHQSLKRITLVVRMKCGARQFSRPNAKPLFAVTSAVRIGALSSRRVFHGGGEHVTRWEGALQRAAKNLYSPPASMKHLRV